MKLTYLAMIGTALAVSACVETTEQPATQSPGDASDLAGFVGAKGGQAEGGLQARGYSLVRTEGLTAYWYNPSNTTCARIVTSDGRYSSVTGVPLANCEA